MLEKLFKSLSTQDPVEGYIRESEFKVFCPVEILEKSKKDDPFTGCHIKGLASTEDQDLQDEILKSKGMDISSLKEGRGVFNYDHKDGPENVIGKIEDAEVTTEGLKVEGYLFKDHDRGKAFLQILKSLKPKDKHRVQMSVEGKILERDPMNAKIINKASITKVALTLDPVNPKTWTELTKSFAKSEEVSEEIKNDDVQIEQSKEDKVETQEIRKSSNEDIAKYMSNTLKTLLKTLSVGNAYQTSPGNMTGGGALTKESLDGKLKDVKKKKKKKKK